jgi:CRM1 C terminal
MGRIFLEMMNLYKAFSGFVSTSIQINGEAVTRTTLVKLMRRAKRDVLNLIDTFVSRSNNPKVPFSCCWCFLMPPLAFIELCRVLLCRYC